MGRSDKSVLRKVKRGRFDFAPRHWARVSSGATALVARLLSVDPRARLTAAQALGDAWLGHGAEAERAAIPGGLVESLRRFSSRDALSKAALHVAAGLLEDAEVRPMRSAFLALDADGDGRLTPAKLREGLAQGDRGLSEQELAKIWGGVDVNGNGTIFGLCSAVGLFFCHRLHGVPGIHDGHEQVLGGGRVPARL
ncbi:unnamed protein product [Prorocentrum cordatum]|uniref:EF-hand domain-containing protein n=1 Tax=Prorocentrum cordatum TaxID=2364126 RepID=A0ABN9TKJ8_9DINO|nr:unnamed protein product [Polarella glacialis]